jgi:hypothetical protein
MEQPRMKKEYTLKTCTRCGHTKPSTAFAIKGLLPTGKTKRRGYCKACYNAARRKAKAADTPAKAPNNAR